jgi:hypothetical protein
MLTAAMGTRPLILYPASLNRAKPHSSTILARMILQSTAASPAAGDTFNSVS